MLAIKQKPIPQLKVFNISESLTLFFFIHLKIGFVLIVDKFDERDPFELGYGEGFNVYISSDVNGIYNIYQHNFDGVKKITNVLGGAFMPSVSSDGRLLFSLYKDGKFRISIINLSELENQFTTQDISKYNSRINIQNI